MQPASPLPMDQIPHHEGSDIVFFNRYTRQFEKEQIAGEKWLRWVYGTPSGKLALHILLKRAFFSKLMGAARNKASSRKDIAPFVAAFGINMEESEKSIDEFIHFNDFFYRLLKPGARPVDLNPTLASFPADARHMGWQHAGDMSNVFVKGQQFDIPALLGDPQLGALYSQGSVILSRLCPTDYHRFHFPVAGTPSPAQSIPGPLASVSPICLRHQLSWLWTNKRTLTLLQTEEWGQVAILAVGATGVGGIHMTYSPGTPIGKAGEQGYFSFGGSTIMTFFEPNRIRLDSDLLELTSRCIELFAKQGDHMGTKY